MFTHEQANVPWSISGRLRGMQHHQKGPSPMNAGLNKPLRRKYFPHFQDDKENVLNLN